MSRDPKTVMPGETLAFRLTDAKQWTWSLRNVLLVTAVTAILIVMLGTATGAGLLTVLFLRTTTRFGPGEVAFGLMLAVVTVAISTLAVWFLLKLVSELWTAGRVGPTLVEVSDHTLHPGQTFELIVAQTGPLRCTLWRVALVAREWTVRWATAPDPLSGQGEIIQPYMITRPVGNVEIAEESHTEVPAGEVRRERWTVGVPDDAVPSSWSRERAVHWGVEVQGDVNGWPKFTRSFPVAMVAEPVPSV
jgi:hypothetical protein